MFSGAVKDITVALVLAVVRWPMCDCRDNPLSAAVGCRVAGCEALFVLVPQA